MKTPAIIFILLFSSFTKTSDPFVEKVYGVWKGYYGNENEINPIIIKINPQNKVALYFDYSENCEPVYGTYKLSGDSAINIFTFLPDKKRSEVFLSGNLYRTVSFIDGKWVVSSKQKGCFFLQKQFPVIDL